MSKEDIFLREYETCHSHNNSIGSEVWISTTVFLSINVALLGGITYGIMTNGLPTNAKWLVLVLGLGIILIFIKWIRWLWRMQFLTSINYERMREIEDTLGMEKNWMARGLDLKYDTKQRAEWDKLPDERKNRINKLSEHYPLKLWKRFPKYARPRGFESLRSIAWIVIVIWLFFIVMAFNVSDCL